MVGDMVGLAVGLVIGLVAGWRWGVREGYARGWYRSRGDIYGAIATLELPAGLRGRPPSDRLVAHEMIYRDREALIQMIGAQRL